MDPAIADAVISDNLSIQTRHSPRAKSTNHAVAVKTIINITNCQTAATKPPDHNSKWSWGTLHSMTFQVQQTASQQYECSPMYREDFMMKELKAEQRALQ